MKTRVIDIDTTLQVLKELRKIREINLEDAVFIRNGVQVKVSQEERESWKFTGMLITDFIELRDWDNSSPKETEK